MATVNIHAAKTHLSRLVAAAERGEETVIARDGRPVAKLTPLAPEPTSVTGRKKDIQFGLLEGKLIIHDDFFDPLPDDILDAFEGS